MQQSRASQIAEPTPIFGAYRRGYDPDQVDRYVADQQRRLDEAQLRASEAERKLAAAVGQLRELHRRVGVLEQSQQRPSQAIRLDGVGDHIQRILEEAREGAEAMRQGAEVELSELRQKTITEARSILAGARKKAEEIELETERRKSEELQRLNEERSRAASQLTYLHEQRKNAVSELLRIREVIDSTIAEVSADLRPGSTSERSRAREVDTRSPRLDPSRPPTLPTQAEEDPYALAAKELEAIESLLESVEPDAVPLDAGDQRGIETARLVRAHRERVSTSSRSHVGRKRSMAESVSRPSGRVFDYEEQ
jgi:hypothetical protein